MARSNRGVAQHRTSPDLPGFAWDVKSTFLPIDVAGQKHDKQAKGVLDLLRVRPPKDGNKGDMSLRFLQSHTFATHSDIVYAAGLNTQPILMARMGSVPYEVASRYTVRPGKRGPIEVKLMIAGVMHDVRDQPRYEEALHDLTIGIGFAVLKSSVATDANTAGFELTVVNNFLSNGSNDLVEVTAGNIAELHKKLSV